MTSGKVEIFRLSIPNIKLNSINLKNLINYLNIFFILSLAHNNRLPISVMDIIQLPMDEFNDLLSKHELTEEQLTLCRDIRRRGKNKVSRILC